MPKAHGSQDVFRTVSEPGVNRPSARSRPRTLVHSCRAAADASRRRSRPADGVAPARGTATRATRPLSVAQSTRERRGTLARSERRDERARARAPARPGRRPCRRRRGITRAKTRDQRSMTAAANRTECIGRWMIEALCSVHVESTDTAAGAAREDGRRDCREASPGRLW